MSTSQKPPPPLWHDRAFIMPQACHLPVEVEYPDGRRERRTKLEGDWRQVIRWRKL